MRRETLEKLEKCFIDAQCVCDPIDYLQRHRDLLYAIGDCLLEELRTLREKDELTSK